MSLTWTKERGMERDNPREHIVVRGGRRTVVVDCEDLIDTIRALFLALKEEQVAKAMARGGDGVP